MALYAHGVPKGLQHFKRHIQQELVKEVHHVLAETVALLQRVTRPPTGGKCTWSKDGNMTSTARTAGASVRSVSNAVAMFELTAEARVQLI